MAINYGYGNTLTPDSLGAYNYTAPIMYRKSGDDGMTAMLDDEGNARRFYAPPEGYDEDPLAATARQWGASVLPGSAVPNGDPNEVWLEITDPSQMDRWKGNTISYGGKTWGKGSVVSSLFPEFGETDLMTTLGPALAMAAVGATGAGAFGDLSTLGGVEGSGGLLTGGFDNAALIGGAGGDTLGAAEVGTGAFDVGGSVGTGLELGSMPGPATATEFTIGPGQTAAAAGVGAGALGTSMLPAATTAGSLIPGIPNNVLGGIGQGLLGLAGANQVAGATSDLAAQQAALGQQYLDMGAPYRGLLEASYQPGFDITTDPAYQAALGSTQDAFLRAASAGRAPGVSGGNPMDNPQAWAETMKYVNSNLALPYMQNYRGQLGQFGGMGVNTSAGLFGNAGNLGLAGAQAQGGMYDALGYGLGTALNPQPSLNDILKGAGNFKLSFA